MRARRWIGAVLLSAVGLSACRDASSIDVPAAEPMAAATDEFPEPFTGPIRMVELHDGRVLLMDTRERRLLRIDFTSGELDTISRQGDGPLEYRSMFVLAAAPGDSVWGFDLVRRQMMVFAPNGEPVRSFSTTVGDDPLQRLSAPWLQGVDSSGRWLGRGRRFRRDPPRLSDTLVVLRMDPVQQRADTVTTLAYVGPKQNADGSSIITNFTDTDGWAALSDGRVLVVRSGEYRVHIFHPDGRVEDAGTVPHRRVALSVADAEFVRDSVAKQLGALVAATMANIPELRNRPRLPTHVLPNPIPAYWPLLAGADEPIFADRQDRVWVHVRTTAFDSTASRFDLISRDGRFIRAVQVPAGEQLVGFGRSVAFLARRDGDGLLWLKRHPLP